MDYNKKAFSLTELLIVLVVLAVLFAALAPITTKRRNGAGYSNESVWNYVNSDDQRNSFYDPGMENQTSAAYVGYDPNTYPDTAADFKAKLVIRAMPGQRQIQFRYGDGYGANAGSLFVDNSGNLMLAGDNNNFVNQSNSANPPTHNTIAGANAARLMTNMQDSVAFGAQTLAKATTANSIIAVGGMTANQFTFNSSSGIFLGASTARTSLLPIRTVLIGAKSATSPTYAGADNVYLGAETGSGSDTSYLNGYSVIAGSTFYGDGTYTKNNTIIGYDTFSKGQPKTAKITAAGFAACDSINNSSGSTTAGSRTCLGYYSAAAVNGTKPSSGQNTTDPSTGLYNTDPYSSDSHDHIFIGGQPFPVGNSFVGRSVLEVHNQKVRTKPDDVLYDPSVILNSNLVVRGNLYLSNELKDKKHPRLSWLSQRELSSSFLDMVKNGDSCYRIPFRSQDWHHSIASYRKDDPWSRSVLQWEYDDDSASCYDQYGDSYFKACPYMPRIVSSDIRLKENISENNDGLELVSKLMPYNYVFKDDKNQASQVGVIAQDLEKVFKNSVKLAHDGYLHIRWDEMFYAAINSIKQLSIKVDKIAEDLSNIESDINDLNSSHKNIKKRIAVLNARAAKLEKR